MIFCKDNQVSVMKLRSVIFLLLSGVLGLQTSSKAQLVGDQIFLQGRWLEVGVAPNGCWGNTMPVPASYHTHTGAAIGSYPDPLTGVAATGNGIDFSYDVGRDGWTAGEPASAGNCCFYGAFFLPGTPFDGWSIQMNGIRSDAFYTSGPVGGFAVSGGATFSGTNVGYESNIGSPCGPYMQSNAIGKWAGNYTAGGSTISIRTTNRVDTNASWDLVNVTIKNTGATPATGVYYFVTGDPDNDQTITGGSFPTNNRVYQQGDAAQRRQVLARAPTRPNAFSGLAAKDCRAKALIYTAWPPTLVPGNALDLIYNQTATGIGTAYYNVGDHTGSDIAYGLVFKLGDLAPGDSTRLSFAWVFSDSTAIDSAFQSPTLNVNCALAPSIDTFYPCGLATIPVSIVNGEWGTTNWVWSPATGLSSTTGTSNTITTAALGGEITYTITGTDTVSCNQFRLLLTLPACFTAISNSPDTARLCVGDTLTLTAIGDSTGATYEWRGPGLTGIVRGFAQSVNVFPTVMSDTGWYYVVKTVGGVLDTVRTHVMLKPLPLVTATYNPPVCSGTTLLLSTTPDSLGQTWSWTGPNGFTSGISDPVVPSVTTAASGLYKIISTLNGCIDSTTLSVTIDSTPEVPTIGSNSFVCEGDTLLLTSSCATPGVTYSWTGPSGFTSTMQNPMLTNAPLTASGTYTVTVRLGTCTNRNTVLVEIRPTPVPVLGSNSPVCSGNALNLNCTVPVGAIFDWSGPSGFVSTVQNPSINPAYTNNSGTYSVTVTLNGCPSVPANITVVVDTTPTITLLTTNSPGAPGPSICEGDTLTLNVNSTTLGVGYVWSGPMSFTSTSQNPVIYPASVGSSGVYTVVVAVGSCSVSAAITVTVTATPPVTITSNTPVCSGANDTLFLQAISTVGATFTWTGPYTFFSNAQNPSRTPVSVEHSGVYNVTVFLDGCYNNTSHTVVVNPTPAAPWIKWLTYCQYYDAPYLQAFGSNVLWYTSSAGGTGTAAPPKPQTDVTGISFYYVNQTVEDCPSVIDSIRVLVNPKPTVTVSEDETVCPRDSVVMTAVNTDAIAYYNWYPYMYLNDTVGATVVARPETNMEYTVVTRNMYNCTDTGTIRLMVKPDAVIHLEDSVTLYPGETYQLDPSTNCNMFSWTPSGGLSGKYISNPIAAPEVSTKYVVTGVTEWGCKTKDSINVNVVTEGILTVPNAFAPGNGINSKFKIIRRGFATLRHFRIYDRWGVMVFESKDIEDGWDGTYKGVPQPLGVYVYDISAATASGKVFNKSGNVTLLR